MKILLLDTNFSSYPIYKYLTGMGHDVWFCGRNPDDFLARYKSEKYINVDYSDVISLRQHIDSYGYDIVMPGCNDRSYMSCAELSENTEFSTYVDSYSATEVLLNKLSFREYAFSNNIPAPRILKEKELGDYGKIIIKPVDAYSGRGISVLDGASDIDYAIKKAKSFSASGNCIIEQYVTGQLYSHSAFIENGRIKVDFIVQEYGSVNPFVVDTSFVVSEFDEKILSGIRNSIEFIAKNLNLQDGLIHTQFICNGNEFWLIEITRRCPGDLYSMLIELSTGYRYADTYTSYLIGEKAISDDLPEERRYILRHTITSRHDVNFFDLNFNQSVRMTKYISLSNSGDLIRQSPFGRIGLAFIDCENEDMMFALKNNILNARLYSIGN